MADVTGLLIAAFSFVALVILMPPLCYHIQNHNIPASFLIFWFCLENLFAFVNALIWSGDDYSTAADGKIYCDIAVRISSGLTLGQLCATACITFNLYMIIAAKNHGYLARGSRIKTTVNFIMCAFNPLLLMGLSVIVQTNRYNITRYRGCTASYDDNIRAVMLVSIWNVVWIALAFLFAALTIIEVLKKRKDVRDILRCTNSGLNLRRFSRLLIFSFLVILVLSPLTLHGFASDVIAANNVSAYTKAVYSQIVWSDIYAIDTGKSNLSSTIICIVLSFCTFFIFGLGVEAIDMYRSFLVAIGFSLLKKNNTEFYAAKEFNESRHNSKTSDLSEKTLDVNHLDEDHFQSYVLEKGPFAVLPDSFDKISV